MRTWSIGLILSLTAFATGPLSAQDKPQPRTFRGAFECLKCHNGGLPKEPDPLLAAAGFPENLTDDSWVLLDELKTWIATDRHLQAFTALKNERSKRMGQLLGVE